MLIHCQGRQTVENITLRVLSTRVCAPNVSSVALQIFLTLPITVASGKRSFSKLKLIKTRSTMSQSSLRGLATVSVEHQVTEPLDCKDLIQELQSLPLLRQEKYCLTKQIEVLMS